MERVGMGCTGGEANANQTSNQLTRAPMYSLTIANSMNVRSFTCPNRGPLLDMIDRGIRSLVEAGFTLSNRHDDGADTFVRLAGPADTVHYMLTTTTVVGG